MLSKSGKVRVWRIHQLVAGAFVPNPHNKETVNHEDGNKANNTPRNLTWMTRPENEEHAKINGLKASGERINHAKLTADKVRQIKVRWAAGEGTVPLSKEFGVSNVSVHNIVRGKTWRGVT
jgi:hypothetical protein